jgi:4-hydroxy-tetrahydrodipicolinate synthase
MNNTSFSGTGVALITPFKKDESIDFDALKRLIDFNINNGIDYFIALGTTGETATLSKDEKKEVYQFISQTVGGRKKIVAGIGGNNTKEIASEIEKFDSKGYDAILSVSPYYNRPTQEGIYQHYKILSESSSLPIIIYNVPIRTGSNISADTTLRLARLSEKFIAIKEASGVLSQVMQIEKNKPAHFSVISGDDNLTLPMMSFGAIGVISVVAQALPKSFSSMVQLALQNDFQKARVIHLQLLDAMELFFKEGNPAGVKSALKHLQICEDVVRLPLLAASKDLSDSIALCVK